MILSLRPLSLAMINSLASRLFQLSALILVTATLPCRGAALPEVHLGVGSWNPSDPSPLKSPFGIDFDQHGNMVIVELEGGRVHQLTSAGKLRQISGDGSKSYTGDGGLFRAATYNGMHNVAIAEDNTIYIADSWNHCVRKVDANTGVITTFAGIGQAGFASAVSVTQTHRSG